MWIKVAQINCRQETVESRWSLLSKTGQKSDSMFATVIHTALFYTILFTLFWTEFLQYRDAFKNWFGGVYILKRIHNKISNPMCYHYCFRLQTMRRGLILALALAVCL